MKLVRFATNDTPSRPGVMIDDAVIALGDLLPEAPTDMIGVIDRWEEIKGPLTKELRGARSRLFAVRPCLPRSSVRARSSR
jgi:hypothetical protein